VFFQTWKPRNPERICDATEVYRNDLHAGALGPTLAWANASNFFVITGFESRCNLERLSEGAGTFRSLNEKAQWRWPSGPDLASVANIRSRAEARRFCACFRGLKTPAPSSKASKEPCTTLTSEEFPRDLNASALAVCPTSRPNVTRATKTPHRES